MLTRNSEISPAPDTIEDPQPRLTSAEYGQITRFARERFGLDLKAGKEDLVTARLSKKIRQGGYKSFGEYLAAAQSDSTGGQLTDLIHALTTHHTSFHREPPHFEMLESLLRGELKSVPVLKIWSAACSTGEEPYSIAACLTAVRPSPASWEIQATDVSATVLGTARRAIYPASAVSTLPEAWLRACFLRGHGKSEGWYRVRPEIAARVHFDTFNLVDSAPVRGQWHIIFCRNVMIYFDKATQEQVVRRLATALEPGGYLLVGHSESLAGVEHDLTYVRPATYRRLGKPARGRH